MADGERKDRYKNKCKKKKGCVIALMKSSAGTKIRLDER